MSAVTTVRSLLPLPSGTLTISEPWRVTGATFVEIEIRRPSDRQMRVEFDGGVRLVITEASQVALASSRIETLRAGKDHFQ